jgi:hypothetical protein
MTKSTLYLGPATGELSDEPAAGHVRVPGAFTVGVTARAVIFHHVHDRYEAHGMVAALGMRDREAAGPLAFARALLAASSRACRQYRQWARGFHQELSRVVAREGRANAPAQSWASYIALVNARTSLHDALRALARLSVPAAPRTAPTQPLALGDPVGRDPPPPRRTGGSRLADPSGRRGLADRTLRGARVGAVRHAAVPHAGERPDAAG